jgi:hypothetical protein
MSTRRHGGSTRSHLSGRDYHASVQAKSSFAFQRPVCCRTFPQHPVNVPTATTLPYRGAPLAARCFGKAKGTDSVYGQPGDRLSALAAARHSLRYLSRVNPGRPNRTACPSVTRRRRRPAPGCFVRPVAAALPRASPALRPLAAQACSMAVGLPHSGSLGSQRPGRGRGRDTDARSGQGRAGAGRTPHNSAGTGLAQTCAAAAPHRSAAAGSAPSPLQSVAAGWRHRRSRQLPPVGATAADVSSRRRPAPVRRPRREGAPTSA